MEEKELLALEDTSSEKVDEEVETKKKSNLRIFFLFVILDLILFGIIIWQLIAMFIQIASN